MEEEICSHVPCSSIAVESVIRMGTAGLIWGVCASPYDAKKLGLTGAPRAACVAKSVGQSGFQCGLFAGIFSITRCGIQRYRKKNDWVNALIAGATAGAAVGVGTRNWKQLAGIAALASAIFAVADSNRTL